MDLEKYDRIFCYTFTDTYALETLQPYANKTVIMIGQARYTEAEIARIPAEFLTFGYVSIPLLREFAARYPGRVHLFLSHGVDTDLFSPLIKPDRAEPGFVIGWAGDPSIDTKNYGMVSEIMGLLGPGYRLETATSVPHPEMGTWYNGLDCYIVTSLEEAHPMTVYEAMSCGIPVITTNVGDVSENIVQYVSGYIVPKDAMAQNFATIIRQVAKARAHTRFIGKNARLTILSKWDWSRIKRDWEAFCPPDPPKPAPLPAREPSTPFQNQEQEIPKRMDIVVDALSWGGNYFLEKVAEKLVNYCDFNHVQNNKTLCGTRSNKNVLYIVSPRISTSYLINKTLKNKTHIVWHWIGSDVMALKMEYEALGGKLPEMFTDRPEYQHHIGVSTNLCEELKEMGIDAEEMNLISNWSYAMEPMPEKFTVLVYYPPAGADGPYQNLYGQDVIKRIIAARPQYQFLLYGLRKNQEPDIVAPNVEIEYFLNDMEYMRTIYKRGSVLLRYNRHDGYPSSIIEAAMMGRHVVTNGKFPYTCYVNTEYKLLETLDRLSKWPFLNIRGSRYYHEHQSMDVYLRWFMDYLQRVVG